MAMKAIGAGFGRTGTMSLKLALEQLGFAPCYHMLEVIEHPGHAEIWHEAAKGEPADWRSVLNPYRAAVDWPVCHFWRELARAFPHAKFLLTERDPDAWYNSMSQTIFDAMNRSSEFANDPVRGPQMRMARYIVDEKTFAGKTGRESAIAVYRAHNEAVKRTLPRERLLVYDVAEGWAPLCEFLGVEIPDAPFPRTNSAEEFRGRIPGFQNR